MSSPRPRAARRAARPPPTAAEPARELFVAAVEAAQHLKYEVGLQAIAAGEGRGRISAKDPRSLLGSAFIDRDCKSQDPHGARWDYVLGYERGGGAVAYFVEVHGATTHGVGEVIAKLEWLLTYLDGRDQAQLREIPREIYWVAQGPVAIPPHTGQYRHLRMISEKKKLRDPVERLELA